MRILYVEDNAAITAGVQATLARELPDCRLETVAHLAGALARIDADAPDLDLVLWGPRVPDDEGLAQFVQLLTRIHARGLPLAAVLRCAATAREALTAALRNLTACDVVALDDPLPELDAPRLLQLLVGQRGCDLPVVLVCASGEGKDSAAARRDALPVALEIAYRKAELARERDSLRESETRIRLLLDSTAEAIFGIDLDGLCTFVNPACLRLLGYERAEDLLGRQTHALTHHSHADGSPYPREECPIYRAFLSGQPVHCDSEVFWRQDGSAVPVEYWSYPMFRQGQVVGAVVTFFDISERRRAEEKLRQAAMVFEHTRDGVMITDTKGRILAINPAFSEITGYGEAEVRGRGASLLNSGRHDPAFFQAMWSELQTNGYWQGEVWNRRKNGEIYLEWRTISSVRDAAGNISHYVGIATDISQLKRREEQLDHLAHHDPLTDLPNRALVQLRLEHALEHARRHGQRVGVLYLDLNQFKAVNDGFGHQAGDGLLREVVERLRGRVRHEDTLGRMGGDQFLVLLEQINDPQEALEVARNLLAVLEPPFTLPGGHEIFLGASIGISIHPDDADDASALLRNAEVAMYQAKTREQAPFCFYTADMNADAVANLGMEAALRRALERDELELHYQPKVDLQSGHMVGMEALLRWRRNGGGLVSPGEFIPVAEKSGLIVALGAWAIDAACAQMRAWREAGLPAPRVAVNVSARQFRAADLEQTVAEALQRHGVAAQHLELELTESMLMADPDSSAALLDRLKALGVRLSLDDFGTGYSSFTYLSRFPMDAVKIDQSFIRDLTSEPDAAGIVSAIIGLAQRLHLQVVAEGVENAAQIGYLRRLGCDLIQGYFFSPPLPAPELAELLRADKSLPTPEGQRPGQRTLLLVDDEPHVLKALRRMLHSEGYHILTAESAREGLELLAQHPAQVILSDQRMPGMTGTEFLGRVRSLHPDTIRIVLSGFAELETIIQAVNLGAIYKFLIKPWDDDLLRGHIRDAFRYHEAMFPPRAAPFPDQPGPAGP